jgi:hypothetical protein
MQHMNDQRIVVTGASEGLGFEMTKAFLARGAKVTAVARNAERLSPAHQSRTRRAQMDVSQLATVIKRPDVHRRIAIILHALAIARQRGLHDYRTVTVLFTPDEEKGSLGSREIIGSLSAQRDWVLSYEPPDGERVIVGTKGIAHVQMDVVGRASHAGSAPEKGRNAVIEVAAQILQLDHLGDAAKGTRLPCRPDPLARPAFPPTTGARPTRFTGENFQRNLHIVEEVETIASEADATPAQIALAWLLAQGDDIAPIPGTKRVARVEEDTAADRVELSAKQIERLNSLAPAAGERHDEGNMAVIDR